MQETINHERVVSVVPLEHGVLLDQQNVCYVILEHSNHELEQVVVIVVLLEQLVLPEQQVVQIVHYERIEVVTNA